MSARICKKKKEVRRLSSLQGTGKKESNKSIFNITANDFSVINCGSTTYYNEDSNTMETVPNRMPVLTRVNDERDDEEADEEADEEENPFQIDNIAEVLESIDVSRKKNSQEKIPSDLTVDHHPNRTCEYIFTYAESDDSLDSC
ncbi:hypothetical protein INT45_012564 [Circinella minor]|uniref:Uncharacterized protein n=1 Tax=Circinella minor TaxID=1195481 RepID=A0A8H7VHH5_9FUNG|nr:hypothetical protein INT45_012564 [Circinella minor]